MDFMLKLPLLPAPKSISHQQKIFLVGSCFTQEIGNRLKELKFNTCINSFGTLYDPLSIARSLKISFHDTDENSSDFFQYNDLWHNWHYHSEFSDINKEVVIQSIKSTRIVAQEYLQKADWLIITLGSSYAYKLKEENRFVANCHKAPAIWFEKLLIPIETSLRNLSEAIKELRSFNPKLKVLLTVSPVRHLRDGIIENSRSKARCIEVCHLLSETLEDVSYFPAYELVVDILRDYRFSKEDMAHPNVLAIKYVLERFSDVYFDTATVQLNKDISKLIQSKNHRALQPGTEAFKTFLMSNLEKTKSMMHRFPEIDLKEELEYFEGNSF